MRISIFVAVVAATFSGFCATVRAAPPLSAYGALPDVSSMELSPSGDRFAEVAFGDGGNQLLIVRKLDGAPIFAGNLGDQKIRSVEWAGDNHLLIIGTATVSGPLLTKGEWTAIGVLDLRTRRTTAVFRNNADLMEAVFGYHGWQEKNGRTFIFVGGVRRDAMQSFSDEGVYPDLYRVDIDSGQVSLLAQTGGRDRQFVVEQGEVTAHSNFDPATSAWRLYLGAKEDVSLATRTVAHGLEGVDLEGPGRRPGSAIIFDQTGARNEEREFAARSPREGIVLPGGEDGDAMFDRRTGLLIGFDPGRGFAPQLFDASLQLRVDASRKAFPGKRAQLVSYDHRFDHLIFFVDGDGDAGGYWLVDVAASSATPLAATYPDIGPGDVGPTKTFAFKAADGLAMDGVLTLPPGSRTTNLPLVVMPHGGPIVGGDTPGFDWWAQAFASRGYAVFQPNYRGTLGYGDAFRRAAEGQIGKKMQSDISDGVAALAAAGIVDPKRACIVGASYGGYAALAGVTVQHGLYRCAVAVAGVSDFQALALDTREESGRDQRALNFWRTLSGMDQSARIAVSPARQAAKADAPVLLIHGKDDTVVPIQQSQEMKRALEAAHKPVEMVIMDGEDHWLSKAQTRTQMLNAAVSFVERYDPPR